MKRKKNPAPTFEKRIARLSKIYNTLSNKRREILRQYGQDSIQYRQADRRAVRANTILLEAAAVEGHRRFQAEKKKRPRKNPAPNWKRALPKNPHDPIYRAPVKLPKYNGTVNALTARSDAGKVLKRVMPDVTKAEHLALAAKYAKRYHALNRAYDALFNKAAMQTWGRPWQFGDYRVSGIGSDEFSPRMKDQLRKANRETQLYADARRAHEYAAGKRNVK